jgi:hypothetical protein
VIQDLIEELIGEEIEDETDASLSPTHHQNHVAGHESSGVKAHSHAYSHRKRRESITQQKITQQAQFLNYITEKRQLNPSSRVGSETVLVVCATLRSKYPDVFGAKKFGDGALEAYVTAPFLHCIYVTIWLGTCKAAGLRCLTRETRRRVSRSRMFWWSLSGRWLRRSLCCR